MIRIWCKGKSQKRGQVLKWRQWSIAAKPKIAIPGQTPIFLKKFLVSKYVFLKYLDLWKSKANEFQMYFQSQAAYGSIFVILFTAVYKK